MPQEVVRLQISVAGEEKALSSLQSLDTLVDRLNKTPVKLNIDTTAIQNLDKQAASALEKITQHINAQARLTEARNKQYAADAKIAIEAEKTKQAVEKTAQAQAKSETVEQRRRLLAEQTAAAQEKAAKSAKQYGEAVSAASKTGLQRQVEAVTGIDREFKSAAESARVFERALEEIEKKAGKSTGNFIAPNAGTLDFEAYLKSAEGMKDATVAATKSVEAGGRTFQQFSASVRNAKGDFDNFTYSVDTATGEVYKFDQGASSANKTAGMLRQTLGDAVVEFTKWYVIGTIISSVTNALSDAVEELRNVDSELVNIQKVMGATGPEMEQLSKRAFEVGSALGVAASDYLSSVTRWAQAGYGQLSADLGELSVRTQKVGDVQEDVADQFLLSVDAAYQYKGNIEALTRVLDGANEISNRYATSVEKLAGGMGIVSSLAAQAGMEVQETMAAIGTITAVTQESGNSAARALRALILNIQGNTEITVDEASGERWSEDEIEATAAALNDLNVATREYKDGVESLRNPMEVIGELSDKYRQGLINEVQLQEVVSSLGGKVRSNQLQALISNYDMYEEMLQTYSESVGSADRELDIYLNSWEAKSERLKNSWTELVASFETESIAKGALDVANALLQIANTPVGKIAIVTAGVVALNAALSALAASQTGIKVIGTIKGIGTAFTNLAGVFKSGGLIAGIKALGSGITAALGPVGLAITAFYALVSVTDYFSKAAERAAEKVSDLSSEYESGVTSLEEMRKQLEDINSELSELYGKEDLSFSDEEDLERLKSESEELQRQIHLQEMLNEAKREELNIASREALNTGYSMEGTPNLWNGITSFAGSFLPGNSDAFNEWGEKFRISMAGDFEGQADEILKMMDELEARKEQYFRSYGEDQSKWTKLVTEAYNGLEKDIVEMQSTAIDFYGQLKNYISGLTDPEEIAYWEDVASWFYQGIAPAQALGERIQTLVDAMGQADQTKFTEFLTKIQEDGVVTAEELQSLIRKFPELNSVISDGAYSLDDLASYFEMAAKSAGTFEEEAGDAEDEMASLEAQAETLSDTLSGLESSLSTISSAQDELAESGRLSASTVDSLVQQFPELTDLLYEYLAGLVSEQELQQTLSQQYSQTAESYRKSIISKMMDNEDFYKSTVLTNTDLVAKLYEIGLTDLDNYDTLADLKVAIEERVQGELTAAAEKGRADREKTYYEEVEYFAKVRSSIPAFNLLDNYKDPLGIKNGNSGYYDFGQGQKGDSDKYWEEILDLLTPNISIPTPSYSAPSKSSSSSSSSTKSWYDTQIENLQELVSQTRDTNTLLEKEEANSYEKRIANLEAMQNAVHQMANEFRARGLSDTSDEVKQLKLMWHDLEDEITSVYQSMYDDLMESQADREWELDLFQKGRENADRSVEEIAADCEKIVSQYKDMQDEVHDLANYYRSQGYDETDELIQNLSDKWWEYQEQIESVYDALTEAFSDYISESDRQIRDLERTVGTAGKQIEIYTQRINEAYRTLQALQAANVNGINDDRITEIQDQISADEDSKRDKQDELWDELESAVDKEFEKWKDKIDEVQDKIDSANEAIEGLEDELNEILEPINDKIDELNERLEAEQEALENLVDPLEKQIEGYYKVNPDGTLGEYIPGINDKLDDLNDQMEAEQAKWDEQQEREEQALALQKKELALQEAIKNLEQAQLDLETAKNERTVYTLKDGVWAWRPDEDAIKEAQDALEDAEQAKQDAEQELNDLKEEQAHNEIMSALEDQIEALEKQKEQIEAQIDIYERESAARQEYLQDQIKRWEQEKESWQDHYDDLQQQYEDDIRQWEARQDELQSQYDEWADQWDSIQESIQEPVRSITEILEDIARYGTPEMQAQVDNITDLLRDMGVALGDFNADIGGSEQTRPGSSEYEDIVDQMRENALAWQDAMDRGDQDAADRYFERNQDLGASIGAEFNSANGKWYDRYGDLLFSVPTYEGGSSGRPSRPSDDDDDDRPSGGSSSGSGFDRSDYEEDIERMKLNAQFYNDAIARGDQDAADMYYEWNQRIGNSIPGVYFNSANGKWYAPDGSYLFDRGGLAFGKGVILKNVDEPELVLNPEQTKAVLASDVLNPVNPSAFDQYARSMGILYGGAPAYTPDMRLAPGGSTTNNHTDSHNTYINGVEIGDSMLDRPLSEVLALLGLHRNY